MKTFEFGLFDEEGAHNLAECSLLALKAAVESEATTLVIFTAAGDGVLKAIELGQTDPAFGRIRLIAVSFPPSRVPEGQPKIDSAKFEDIGVPVVIAHLPFTPLTSAADKDGQRSRLRDILNIFGGGLALCVQAVTMACDAGKIEPGERVVAMSGDTAIVVLATSTEHMFDPTRGLVVERIVCKADRYAISRPDHFATQVEEEDVVQGRLFPPDGVPQLKSGSEKE